jgi:hypothetical protein
VPDEAIGSPDGHAAVRVFAERRRSPPTTRFTALLTGDDLAIEGPSGRRRL